ncbi:MAG: PASTA domain-containing protein [Bacteroidia bacterium]
MLGWKSLWRYFLSREGLLITAAVAAFALLSYILFLGFLLPLFTRHGEEVALPDLTQKPYTAVKQALEEAGLQVVVTDSQYLPDKPGGLVLLQDPAAGTPVKRGRKIYLTLTSFTAPQVALPKVEEMPYEEARRLLQETYGFRIANLAYVEGKEADLVVEVRHEGQRVEAGTLLPRYAPLTLVISRGLGEEKVPFISVVGLPLEEALNRLSAARLTVGHIRYKPVPNVPIGHVYRQYPERVANDSVRVGMPIDLFVNSEPPKSTPTE